MIKAILEFLLSIVLMNCSDPNLLNKEIICVYTGPSDKPIPTIYLSVYGNRPDGKDFQYYHRIKNPAFKILSDAIKSNPDLTKGSMIKASVYEITVKDGL